MPLLPPSSVPGWAPHCLTRGYTFQVPTTVFPVPPHMPLARGHAGAKARKGLSLAVTRGGPDIQQFLSHTHQAASGPWPHVTVLCQLPQRHYKLQVIRFSPGKGKSQRPWLQSQRVTGGHRTKACQKREFGATETSLPTAGSECSSRFHVAKPLFQRFFQRTETS